MIELKNIFKTYDTGTVKVEALSDISLTIQDGEFVSIMGPSGSGKSTLLHILGLLDKPDSGSYLLNGEEVSLLSENELARVRNKTAGFIFQQFHLLPRMTALQNISLPLIYAGRTGIKEKPLQRIAEVGLQERAGHHPNELSGGEQQRVAIARALINDPLFIFADEPTGNLDTKRKDEIMSLLGSLNRQGITIVMVTHEPEIAQKTHRIIHVRDGRILSDTRTNSFLLKPSGISMKAPSLSTSFLQSSICLKDHFKQAIQAIIGHKLRSLLSMLGILIGVMAVIAMLALGQGAKESISKSLSSLGSNLLVIHPGAPHMHGVMMQSGTTSRFTVNDSHAIAKIPKVLRTSAEVRNRAQVIYQNKNWNTQVQGVENSYALLRASIPSEGRFFTDEETRKREKVALIGKTVAKELFDNENPVGKEIKINRIQFQIIGLLPEKGTAGFQNQDDVVIIPITTAMYRVMGKDYLDAINAEIKTPEDMDTAEEAIRDYLRKKAKLAEDAEDTFDIRNLAELQKTLQTTTTTMTMLLGFISMISLFVGGIGIMNIMLVSVTERTREIGLRKALGARNFDIMTQFLIESIVMTFCGGMLGIFLGSGIAFLLTTIAGWATKVSVFSVLLASIFSILVGLVFGLWPARQASQMNVVSALRYE